jgi:hypothetical protein
MKKLLRESSKMEDFGIEIGFVFSCLHILFFMCE